MKILGRRSKSVLAAACSLALVSALGACGVNKSESGGTEVNIAIQGLNLQTLYPLAAEELGYFKKEAVDVKVTVNTVSGGQAIQAMLGGSYQMFFGGADSLVATSLGEKNLRIIAAGANSSIWNLLAKKGTSDVRDLDGKKIAVLSDQGLLTQAVRYALDANGMKEDDVTLLPAGNTPQRIAAMSSGQAEGAVVSIPQNSAAVDKYGYTDLGDLGDLGAPPLVSIALQVDQRWASKHKDEVQKVLRGYHSLVADLYSGKNDAKIVPYFAKKLGVESKYIEQAFDTTFRADSPSKKQLPADLRVDTEALQNTADAFRKFGAIKSEIDAKKIVDNSYLNDALR